MGCFTDTLPVTVRGLYQVQWAARLQDFTGDAIGGKVAHDPSGNSYVTFAYRPLGAPTVARIVVEKRTPNGTRLWSRYIQPTISPQNYTDSRISPIFWLDGSVYCGHVYRSDYVILWRTPDDGGVGAAVVLTDPAPDVGSEFANYFVENGVLYVSGGLAAGVLTFDALTLAPIARSTYGNFGNSRLGMARSATSPGTFKIAATNGSGAATIATIRYDLTLASAVQITTDFSQRFQSFGTSYALSRSGGNLLLFDESDTIISYLGLTGSEVSRGYIAPMADGRVIYVYNFRDIEYDILSEDLTATVGSGYRIVDRNIRDAFFNVGNYHAQTDRMVCAFYDALQDDGMTLQGAQIDIPNILREAEQTLTIGPRVSRIFRSDTSATTVTQLTPPSVGAISLTAVSEAVPSTGAAPVVLDGDGVVTFTFAEQEVVIT